MNGLNGFKKMAVNQRIPVMSLLASLTKVVIIIIFKLDTRS